MYSKYVKQSLILKWIPENGVVYLVQYWYIDSSKIRNVRVCKTSKLKVFIVIIEQNSDSTPVLCANHQHGFGKVLTAFYPFLCLNLIYIAGGVYDFRNFH